MHSRTIIRNPNVCRIATRQPVRHASLFGGPSFYPVRYGVPSFPSFSHDFAPLIKLVDESVPSFDHFFRGFPQPAALRSFSPKFDVQELENSYELRGEIPGVESKDLEVEFRDPETLVIRGKTERESSSGTAPQATEEATTTAEQTAAAETTADDAASVHSGSTSSYQQPTVEEDGAEAGPATPATTNAEAAQPEPSTEVEKTAEAPAQGRYWVSERSTGSFQRVFSFRSRIDHDNVKASLKNGVLEISVPKAAEPEAKKINVE